MAKKSKKDNNSQASEPQGKKGAEEQVVEEKIPARLHGKYKNEIVEKLRTEFKYNNIMEVPRLEKIIVNMGVGWCGSGFQDA